jgi:signal transduction histidine kinase
MDIQADIALPVEVKAALYRITQEALNNIAKHSLANEVRLKLSEHDAVVKFVISDKGRGFDHSRVEPGHFGLAIMRERANAVGGNLDIESQIEHGTKIVFTWARRQIDRPGLFR